MNRLLKGFMAGMLATLPMTACMWMFGHRRKLPPVEITENLQEKTDLPETEPGDMPSGFSPLSLTLHFLYGGLCGGIYQALSPNVPGKPVVKGLGYGTLVWSGNYLGLLPALRLYPTPDKKPAKISGVMILSHLIWGSSLGLAAE